MIEVAHAILSQHGDVMAFVDLANAVQEYLGDSDEEIRERLSQFYTDLNIDGSFISLGDNLWGLRTWYPFESIDEATVHADDDEDQPKKKRRKKVNAFLADTTDDDDVIDYDDDDPEDDTADDSDAVFVDNEGVEEDSPSDLGKYSRDLNSIDDDDNADDEDDDDMPEGIEEQLSEIDDPEADEAASSFDGDGEYSFGDDDDDDGADDDDENR